MIPTIAVPNFSGVSQAPVVADVSLPPHIPANSQSYQAPPVPFSPSALYNNTRFGGAVGGTRALVAIPQAAQTTSAAQISIGSHQAGGFSSQFLAQVIGQGNPANQSYIATLTQELRVTSPTLSTREIERFSDTKYYPSLAAKPRPAPTGTAQIAEAVRQLNAQSLTQVREARVPSPLLPEPVISASVPTPATSRAQPSKVSGSVRFTGANAYAAAQARVQALVVGARRFEAPLANLNSGILLLQSEE